MASTFSPSLKLELIGDGDQSGIWGQTTNNNLGTLLEQAIAGVVTITMTDTNYTLTSFNGVADEARNAVIIATGTNSAQRNIIAPLVEKTYIIRNSTTGGFAVQIIGASGTGVVIPNGVTAMVYCDGTNFLPAQVNSIGNQTINGNLAVTGTTSLTGALTASTGSFSGVLTAPTAAPGTSTTQVATTAFVQNVAGTLGTMSQQNANNVAITGGAINGTTVGASTATTVRGTTVTATTQFSGPGTGLTGTASGLSIGGTAATATSPASGGSFITSSNIASQSVAFATNATNATNATAATQSSITSIPNLNTVGTISSGTWSGSFGAVSGANLTNLNASNLASGTVPSGRLSGTYGINISGNAATATTATTASNGGVTSVNSTTGAVVTPVVIDQGEYGVNGVLQFAVSNSRPTMLFVYFGNGAGGNSFLFSNVEWGMGSLTNQRIWYQSGVDFQVAESGSLLTVIPAGSGTVLNVRINANFVGGYGAPSTARIMVVQF